MVSYVHISDEILEWLNGQSGSFPKDVCEKLEAWRSGKKKPTFSQVEEMSQKTEIPFGYFFLTHPPDENRKLLNFRTINSLELQNPGRNLLNTIHLMEMIQDWLRDRLIDEDAPKISFVGSFRNVSDIRSFAASVREILGISEDWFKNSRNSDDSFRMIRNAMSSAGVFVMMNGKYGNNTKRPFDIEEFRAFAMIDDYAPLIFINSRDSSNGRLFSLLHEFAHICMGESNLYNDRWERNSKVTKTETICNALAAEILVPENLFREEWESGQRSGLITETAQETAQETAAVSQKIDEIAKKFRCSSSVIAGKSLATGLIDKALYEKIIQDAAAAYQRSQNKTSGGGDYYKNLISYNDRRFLKMLSESVSEGTTSYTDAFHLTNTNRNTFGNLIRLLESDSQ